MSRRYAVVGNPVHHSKSPWLHAQFARQTQRDMVYAALAPTEENFADAVRTFFAGGGIGLNITVPFKESALALADSASHFAQRARAANVLKMTTAGLKAYNTDGAGLLRDLSRNVGEPISQRRILILGAGGAARAAALALAAESPADLCIAARDAGKAATLAELCGSRGMALAACAEPFDLIFNATSAALSGQSLPLSRSVFVGASLAYDLSYGAAAHPFLAMAKEATRRVDGLGMLAEQAALSFAIWEDILPSTAKEIQRLRKPSA